MIIFHYLKSFFFHVVGITSVIALLAGGNYALAGFAGIVFFYLIGDAFGGDDTSSPKFKKPGILTVQLWLALPLLMLIMFTAVWTVSSGDPLGYGAFIQSITGYDVFAAREANGLGTYIGMVLLSG